MEYIHGTKDFKLEHTIVTIGKFDGVHCGHRLLLEYMKNQKKEGQRTVVFTFDSPPAHFLSGDGQGIIYSEEEKRLLMEQLGIDVLISYPFDTETSRMLAVDFITKILIKKLGVELVVIGKDCRFGYQRQGDVELLKYFAKEDKFKVKVFEKEKIQGEIVSSTHIRKLLKRGEMETAAELLGEPFMIYGEVIHGRQLGRKLGMPTMNQIPAYQKVLPPNGVYSSFIEIPEEGNFCGITNLGVKPTIGSDKILAETHIFQYSGDLYGKTCKVFLYHFQRGEQKFESVEKLKAQMAKDRTIAKEFLDMVKLSKIK